MEALQFTSIKEIQKVVFWNFEGILMDNYLQNGSMINGVYYAGYDTL